MQILRDEIRASLVKATGRRIAPEDIQQLVDRANHVYQAALNEGYAGREAVDIAVEYIKDAVIFRDMIVKYHG